MATPKKAPSTPVDNPVDNPPTAAPTAGGQDVSTSVDSIVDEPAPTAAPSDVEPGGTCGADVREFNPLFREGITCVLEPGHTGPHTDGVNGQWLNADPAAAVYDPMHLCGECYPAGWPAEESGARATCAHGTWVYPIVG